MGNWNGTSELPSDPIELTQTAQPTPQAPDAYPPVVYTLNDDARENPLFPILPRIRPLQQPM